MKLNIKFFKSHISLYLNDFQQSPRKGNYSGEKKDFLASDAETFGYPYVNISKLPITDSVNVWQKPTQSCGEGETLSLKMYKKLVNFILYVKT